MFSMLKMLPFYILHDLERMTNNMGQTLGEDKHFHMDIQHYFEVIT